MVINETPYANSLFEQPWWLDIVAFGQWKEILIKDENEEIIARMPYVWKKKTVFMPELTQTLGIWMSPKVQEDYGEQKRVINKIFEKLDDMRAVDVALSPNNKYVLPFRWKGYTIEPRFSYRINDLHDCDTLYTNFNKTAKKNIKSAKNKVKIISETNVETLWSLLNHTFEVQKRRNPISKEIMFQIIKTCEENGHGKYFEACDVEGNVHSCAYFVYDEQICYYLLGATDSRYRSSGAQSLILWEGIQFAAQNSKIFDFEGSMVEGIENFFRQFGGTCIPYYVIRKSGLGREIFSVMKPRIKRILGYKI